METIIIEDTKYEIPEKVSEYIYLLARDKTRLDNLLKAQTAPVAEVPCSMGLDGLAQAWDEAARYYKDQEEKQATKYLKGMRAGAAHKLESCANELRALLKEQAD